MNIAPKQELTIFKGSLDNLNLPVVEMHIEPEREQQKQHIQVLQKKNNDKPLEIDGPLF